LFRCYQPQAEIYVRLRYQGIHSNVLSSESEPISHISILCAYALYKSLCGCRVNRLWRKRERDAIHIYKSSPDSSLYYNKVPYISIPLTSTLSSLSPSWTARKHLHRRLPDHWDWAWSWLARRHLLSLVQVGQTFKKAGERQVEDRAGRNFKVGSCTWQC
jgi:hypothetical protein